MIARRIAFLGPVGTYTEDAALKYDPQADLQPFPSIIAVGLAVSSGVTDQGVEDQPFDVFNPTGQYLGTVVAPFRLQASPSPFVRDGALYGVIRDELDVQFVVRARIVRP